MSIRVMSLVWENETLDPYERLVMLSLADHSNDEGMCYPSIRRLCARTGMKERGVQNVVKRLTEAGYITVEMNKGRAGSNLYRVNATPATNAPQQEMHPASDAPTPPHSITLTPAPDAPKPLRTIKEPSVKKQTRMPEDAVISEKQTQIAIEKGHTTEEAIAQFARFKDGALAKGRTYLDWDAAWRSWFTSQYFKTITYGGRHDRTSQSPQHSSKSTGASRNSFLDEIAAAARS
jgi:hypothetical protein